MNDLSFAWDDNKEQIDMKKHGLSFSVAARVFLDPDRSKFMTNYIAQQRTDIIQ